MSSARYLCSQLIRLTVSGTAGVHEQWVNLEEIWDDGAMLECETEVCVGISAMISADGISFSGRITAVDRRQFGWQAEITFSPVTRWSIEKWRPEHAFDPGTLES
jgi:hypothetical protein